MVEDVYEFMYEDEYEDEDEKLYEDEIWDREDEFIDRAWEYYREREIFNQRALESY